MARRGGSKGAEFLVLIGAKWQTAMIESKQHLGAVALVPKGSTLHMRILRLILAAYFLFLSVGSCASEFPQPWNSSLPHTYLLGLRCAFVALLVIYAMGAWSAWRERTAMNFTRIGWPITASMLSLLLGLGVPTFAYIWGDRSNFWHSNRDFAIPVAMGLLGIIAFRRRRTVQEIASVT
jgi:hypothetical protein